MASLNYPASPQAANAENDQKYVIDSAGFKRLVEDMRTHFKNLMKVSAMVYASPKGQKVPFPNGVQIGRSELNAYASEYSGQLKDLSKYFNSSKKRRVHRNPDNNSGDQLRAMFYISDQLVNFLREANLGEGNPNELEGQANMSELGRQQQPVNSDRRPQAYMSLILDSSMATSGILTSVLSLYTTVNQVQSLADGGRIKPDHLMMKYFNQGNTRYYLRGTDMTPNGVPGNVKADKREKFEKNLSQVDMTVIQRIKMRDTDPAISHVDKRGKQVICYKEPVHGQQNDDYGMSYSMYMVLLNYFRIPNEILDPQAIAQLSNPDMIQQASELQAYIRQLTLWHKEVNKEAKKAIQTQRRRQQAAVKKAQSNNRVASPGRGPMSNMMGGYPSLPSLPALG
jgi:hypothetical protein